MARKRFAAALRVFSLGMNLMQFDTIYNHSLKEGSSASKTVKRQLEDYPELEPKDKVIFALVSLQ